MPAWTRLPVPLHLPEALGRAGGALPSGSAQTLPTEAQTLESAEDALFDRARRAGQVGFGRETFPPFPLRRTRCCWVSGSGLGGKEGHQAAPLGGLGRRQPARVSQACRLGSISS